MKFFKRKKKYWNFFVLACFLTVLFSCQDQPTTIMYNVDVNTLHFPVAEKLGLFDEFDIHLQSSHSSASKFSMDALNAGAVDYAVIVDMNMAVNLFDRDNLIILAELSEPITSIKIVGRKDRGILSGDDLRNKNIGVLFGVNIHLFLLKYLEEYGLDENDVNLINMRPPDYIADFRNPNGKIDAIITWQPNIFNLQKEMGDNLVVLTDDSDKYWKYRLLFVTTRQHYNRHPDEAYRMLKALSKADSIINSDSELAKQVLADFLLMNKNDISEFFFETQYSLQLTNTLLHAIEYNIEWLHEYFYSDRTPVSFNLNSLVSPTLNKVNPAAYKIDYNDESL